MKIFLRFSLRVVAALSLSVLFYACSSESTDEVSIDQLAPKADQAISLSDQVFLENGYVRFTSTEAFESYLGEENKDERTYC